MPQAAVAGAARELARALRAIELYPPGHPALARTLEAAAEALRALCRGGPIRVEARTAGALGAAGKGESGPAAELAAVLRRAGVRAMELDGSARGADLEAALRAILAAGAGEASLREALERSAASGIAVEALDYGRSIAERAAAPPSRARAEDGGGEFGGEVVGAREASGDACGPGPGGEAPRARPGEPPPGDAQAEAARRALREALEALERCTDATRYGELAQRVGEAAVRCAEAGCEPEVLGALGRLRAHAEEARTRPEAVREAARQALRSVLSTPEGVAIAVEAALSGDPERSVEAVSVLAAAGGLGTPALVAAHASADAARRDRARAALLALGERAVPALVEELGSSDPERARRAVRLLGDLQTPAAVEILLDQLRLPDLAHAREAARALARVGTPRAIDGLAAALEAHGPLAELAAHALGEARGARAAEALARVARDRRAPEALRREAVRSLGRLGGETAVRALAAVLDDAPLLRARRVRELRRAAAAALGRIGGAEACAALERHARGRDPAVREACREALRAALGRAARAA